MQQFFSHFSLPMAILCNKSLNKREFYAKPRRYGLFLQLKFTSFLIANGYITRIINRCGMGFRFRKSVKILPGVRWNIGKSGSSLSFGGKGLTVNVNKKGTRTTVGIPGTGLSHSTYRPHDSNAPQSSQAKKGAWAWLAVAAIVVIAIIAAS